MRSLSALLDLNTRTSARTFRSRTASGALAHRKSYYLELCQAKGLRPNPINGVGREAIEGYISQVSLLASHADLKRRNARVRARLHDPYVKEIDLTDFYNSHAKFSSCSICHEHFRVAHNTERRIKAMLFQTNSKFTDSMKNAIDKPDRAYDYCPRCFIDMHTRR